MRRLIRRAVAGAALTIPALRRMRDQRDAALAKVADMEGHVSKYVVLPANPYARYALPIEYVPSRSLRPRWGATHPIIAPLAEWIGAHDGAYRQVLGEMRALRTQLAVIPCNAMPNRPGAAWLDGPFSPFDLAALYTLMNVHRPALYVEIGSGISTIFARRAIKDHGLATRIISIDPEPRAQIDTICDEVVREGLETCDPTRFDALRPGDILFLDGSHRVFMNSDVTVFMIDVLPRLRPGVLVHVHDIDLPWDYSEGFVDWYWSEAYILAAYLIGARDRVRPVFPTAWVCRSRQFDAWFADPLVDLGNANNGWRGGGSMWFTHTS